MLRKKASKTLLSTPRRMMDALSPTQLIALSFALLILLGAGLLMLPAAQAPGVDVHFIDALFTATSAVCVTGLVTLTTATTWSLFGQLVIMVLIQFGGLSLITIFFFFFAHSKRKVTIKDRLILQTALNATDLRGMVRAAFFVIRGTLIVEGIAALILFFFFLGEGYPTPTAFFYGIFHAVSGFCNAGFDVIGSDSLIPYSADVVPNVVIMALIILSGLGFSVWYNAVSKFKAWRKKELRVPWTLQSKLVLLMTAVLLLSGAGLFLALEWNNPATMGDFSVPHKVLASAFHSTTLRTAGFAGINQFGLTDTSKFISSLLMMIGGSPGGTAGGIKTVTVAILLLGLRSTASGQDHIHVKGKSISHRAVKQAQLVFFMLIFALITVTTLLTFTERNSAFTHSFLDLFFEVSSALGTVGLTTGITPYLTALGKGLIMGCMFFGRVGPITLMIALSERQDAHADVVRYPSEDLMIG